MKKLIFTASVMLLFFAACGNKSNQNKEGNKESIEDVREVETVPEKEEVKTEAEKEKTMKDILFSSPRFKELTNGLSERVKANGGTGYSLFSDGIVSDNDNEMYSFRLAEEYPERSTAIAHFRFDSKKEKLYEYDIASDQLIELQFDRSLFAKLK